MIVELIAFTQSPSYGSMERAGYVRHDNWVAAADEIAEFAGRLCYQSWARPNPDTAHNAGYLANIIDHEHFSVLEHASATFYVADVSRSLSHELVRHRHLSFSQVSQRYVDESAAIAIVPPALNTYAGASVVGDVMNRALVAYEKLVAELLVGGVSRKEARQAARAVLPNATETKFVVTGNMRAWRDVIAKRISPTADAEIRQLADELLARLRTIAPNTFQDM